MAALASRTPASMTSGEVSNFGKNSTNQRKTKGGAAVPPVVGATAPAAHERSVYEPNQRSGIATLASLGMIAIVCAGLATINVVAERHAPKRLTVVDLHELETIPPPPEPAAQPTKAAPPVAFVPKPLIRLPSSGPTQVALDLPLAPSPEPAVVGLPDAPVVQVPAPPALASASVEGGDLSSKVLVADPPSYPVEARRKREQGTVKLSVLVGIDGRVKDISVSSSSGSPRLDRAALHAVRRWRWSPNLRGGVATMVRGFVTIPFVLTG